MNGVFVFFALWVVFGIDICAGFLSYAVHSWLMGLSLYFRWPDGSLSPFYENEYMTSDRKISHMRSPRGTVDEPESDEPPTGDRSAPRISRIPGY